MKTFSEWLALYEQDHQHPANKILHKIAVPLIMFSSLAFLWALPAPQWMYGIKWSFFMMVLSSLFYIKFSLRIAALMYVIMLGQLFLARWLLENLGSFYWGFLAFIFVGAWILQFVGHALEGRKPSFFADPRYLFIGPVWVLLSLMPKKKSEY